MTKPALEAAGFNKDLSSAPFEPPTPPKLSAFDLALQASMSGASPFAGMAQMSPEIPVPGFDPQFPPNYLAFTNFTAPLTRDKESSDKTKHMLAVETLIKSKIAALPKTVDIQDARKVTEYMKRISDSCRMVVRYQQFLPFLEEHSQGPLQRRIQDASKSLGCRGLLDGTTSSSGVAIPGYNDLYEQYEMDMLQATVKGDRQVLPPDCTMLWDAFKSAFLRGLLREWKKAHGCGLVSEFKLHSGRRADTVVNCIDTKEISEERADRVGRSGIRGAFEGAHGQFAVCWGLDEYIQAEMEENHLQLIDPMKYRSWDFHAIADCAIKIETSPKYKIAKRLRDQVHKSNNHREAAVTGTSGSNNTGGAGANNGTPKKYPFYKPFKEVVTLSPPPGKGEIAVR
jgi:hypothetical protein